MVNIAFFSTKPYDRIWFETLGEEYGYRFIFFESKLSIETVSLAAGCNGVCAFVNDNIDGDVINELADIGVETIYMRCAGYNNVDLEAAKGKLKVLHVPGYSPEAVAEYAVALLMTINRHTHRAYLRTRDFNMNINGLMGTDLYCKIIGIIGTGRIGQAMINIAKGFGMRVLAYDLYPNPSLGVEYVELDELLEKSDVISLHCPLTKETEYILDKRSFDRMKDGVYIVNTSRGGLIKTEDLIDALLVPGKIAGVGLDVYEEEADVFYEDRSNEIMRDNNLARLMTFPNVIVTSHQGYFTTEAMQAIAIETMENIFAVENGNELVNEVKK